MIRWKKKVSAALLGLLLGCVASPLYAAGELKRFDPVNKTCRTLGFDSYWYGKGRRLFDQKCKVCHTKKNKDAPFLYSESKPAKGWTRVFFTRYPQCARDGSWQITADQALLINDYLFRYSANTHNPYKAS